MNFIKSKTIAAIVLTVFTTGCSMTSKATDFNGMAMPEGQPVAHLNTTNYAVHLFVGQKPVLGNASLEETVSDLTSAAKQEGASKVRIVQSSVHTMWYILFPITLLVTPVITQVAGDAT